MRVRSMRELRDLYSTRGIQMNVSATGAMHALLTRPHDQVEAADFDASKNEVAIESCAARSAPIDEGAQRIIAILLGL
jgi:hypothetical protein